MSGETVPEDGYVIESDGEPLAGHWRDLVETTSVRSATPVPTERAASSVSESVGMLNAQVADRLAEQVKLLAERQSDLEEREKQMKRKQAEMEKKHQQELSRIREEVRSELDEHLQRTAEETSKTLSRRRHMDSKGGQWSEKKRQRAAAHAARMATGGGSGGASAGTSGGSQVRDGFCSRCNKGQAGSACVRGLCSCGSPHAWTGGRLLSDARCTSPTTTESASEGARGYILYF